MAESGKRVALAMLGLALFWPILSYSLMPSEIALDSDMLGRLPEAAAGALRVLGLAVASAAFYRLSLRKADCPDGASAERATRVPAERCGSDGKQIGKPCVAVTGLALALFAIAFSAASSREDGSAAAFATAAALAFSQGAFGGMLAMAWAWTLESFGRKKAFVVLSFSFALNFVCVFLCQELLQALGFGRIWLATASLPLLSGVLWLLLPGPSATVAKGRTSTATPKRQVSPFIIMLVAIAAYLFASYVFSGLNLRGNEPFSTTTLSKALAIFLAASLALYSVLGDRGLDGLAPWVGLVIVCVVASYCVGFLTSTFPALCSQIVLPTRMTALFFSWATALMMAWMAGRSPQWGTLVGFTPIVALESVYPLLASGLLSLADGHLSAEIVLQLCAIPAMLLLIIALVLVSVQLREVDREVTPKTQASENDGFVSVASPAPSHASAPTSSSPTGTLPDACRAIGKQFGLTPREIDVLELLAQGHSQKKIAEVLVVSPSSTQTYTKSIYRKMGVHSRQEVIDLVRDSAHS